MAKNPNSYEKKRREIEKKFKAEEKRKARLKKKLEGAVAAAPGASDANSPAASETAPE